jgi:hypothetical protein
MRILNAGRTAGEGIWEWAGRVDSMLGRLKVILACIAIIGGFASVALRGLGIFNGLLTLVGLAGILVGGFFLISILVHLRAADQAHLRAASQHPAKPSVPTSVLETSKQDVPAQTETSIRRTLDSLTKRGEHLRLTELNTPHPPTDLEKRYEPMKAAAATSRYIVRHAAGATGVNEWLKDVAELVLEQFPQFEERLVDRAITGPPKSIVNAIDRTLTVLEEIRSDISSTPGQNAPPSAPKHAHLVFGNVRVKPPLNLMSDGIPVGKAVYCHVTVQASAKLDQVKGEVILLEKQDASGGYVPVDNFKAPHELRWDKPYVEHVDYMRATIYPDIPGRLNLVNTESTDPHMTHLCVPRHAPGMGTTKLRAGDYRLTVRVSAPGVAHVDSQFLIHAGEWNEVNVVMND